MSAVMTFKEKEMHTDDESEIEYTVAKRVASVTIESDSQVEAEAEQRSGRKRRKKRIVKRKNVNEKMDVDINVSQLNTINKGSDVQNVMLKLRMDWDGLCSTSELSSSETCTSDGREADDEQSDWVGPVNEDQNFPLPQTSTKQQRFIKTRTASAALQRKLERFIRDDSQRELIVKHWTSYRQVSRIMEFFGLEVSKRGRGTVIPYMPRGVNLTGRRRLTFKVELGVPPKGAFTGHDFEVLVNEAIRLILGQTAPNYSFGPFNEIERKGSVVVQASDVNLIWAALSVYGRFFGKPIALHFNSNDKMDIYFSISCLTFAVVFIYGLLLILVYISLPQKKPQSFEGKHAFITGGSKGIGKAIAVALIRRGCSVSLAARNAKQLELVCNELNAFAKTKKNGAVAKYYSVDVTSSYNVLEAIVKEAESELGDINILVNNAGCAVQGSFDSLDVSVYEKQMSLNFLSSVYMTKAVVSKMKESRDGHIIFVNSAAGQCPIWGYTAYGATKFAVRGFAEALHMELLPYNVQVSIIYPPNTNTEGYQHELLTMPKELKEINSCGGLFEPETVAECLIYNLSRGNYHTCIGLEGWMLGVLSAGGAPEKSFLQAAAQVLFGGLLRAIMLIYIGHFNWIVEKCKRKR
uniref:3-dehydrosphinganine reductase n=1 Tax=Onchocerca volvulus TaxID=6282 RepID=A0A8R1TSR4_ONCVO